MNQFSMTRRDCLQRGSVGFGMTALAGLLAQQSGAVAAGKSPGEGLHHAAKAKHVIFCYMSGGVSHVDSFDPKPRLKKEAGKALPMKVERTMFNNNGKIMPSPFEFKNSGESGTPVSSMFPHIAKQIDEIAVVRSMTAKFNEHAQANFGMHSCFPFLGYPSAGAWTTYGLGTENENLPGYVVLQSGNAAAPHGGVGLFSNGFLPAQHQGSIIKAGQKQAVPNIGPAVGDLLQRRQLDFIRQRDQQFQQRAESPGIEAAIKNYETAYRMQTAVPELCEISKESAATQKLYGVDSTNSQLAGYARQCLLARRLVQRGVRFVELSCLPQTASSGQAGNPWDQHGGLKSGHQMMARQVDQPIAALIQDLRTIGLLDETLIIWAGEFGRTPFSQGSDGRDHNPFGFSVWMAGGGIKGGITYGETDEYGYHVVENKCTIYDMWATVLHQLGVDHERLTYRYGGRDFRLTDVHGEVLTPLLA